MSLMTHRGSFCDRAENRALAQCQRAGTLSALPLPVRTVALLCHAQGIIDNGGLQYFFENDWVGQPPYCIFVKAYRRVGADDIADALEKAVALFPFPQPERYRKRRDTFLEQFLNGGWHRKDSPFEPYTNIICGHGRIWSLLEEYIKANANWFRRGRRAPRVIGRVVEKHMSKPKSIDEYLDRVSAKQRAALLKLRKAIHAAAPQAEECISYQLPAFRQGRMLVGFGATAKHCAFYLMSSTVLQGFAEELEGYDISKGTIRFQPERPLPSALVRRLVKARLAENARASGSAGNAGKTSARARRGTGRGSG